MFYNIGSKSQVFLTGKIAKQAFFSRVLSGQKKKKNQAKKVFGLKYFRQSIHKPGEGQSESEKTSTSDSMLSTEPDTGFNPVTPRS